MGFCRQMAVVQETQAVIGASESPRRTHGAHAFERFFEIRWIVAEMAAVFMCNICTHQIKRN